MTTLLELRLAKFKLKYLVLYLTCVAQTFFWPATEKFQDPPFLDFIHKIDCEKQQHNFFSYPKMSETGEPKESQGLVWSLPLLVSWSNQNPIPF